MSLKILDKDLKIFAIWWVLLAMVSWFGPLIFVLGVLQKHQDQEAWLLVFLPAVLFTVFGQYVLLRTWFRRAGLGTPAIYLPIKSTGWVTAAFGVELLTYFLLDFILTDALFGPLVTMPLYAFFLPMIPQLYFWRPRNDNPPKVWIVLIILLLFGSVGMAFLYFFVLDDPFVKVLSLLPTSIVWLVSFGFLGTCLKGSTLYIAFRRWRIYPDVEERYDLKRSRKFMSRFILGTFVLFSLLSFAFPFDSPQFLGIQPCGWLDIRLGRSHCLQSWFVDYGIESPSLSPDGTQMAAYDNDLSLVEIRSVESGEVTERLPIDIFVNDFVIPDLIFSPDGRLLLFSSYRLGAYLWDIQQDLVIPIAPVVGAEKWGRYKFSADGKEIVFEVDGDLVVWDTQLHRTINRTAFQGHHFQFLDEEKAVLMIGKEQVLRWDYLTKQEAFQVRRMAEDETELFSKRLYDVQGNLYTVMGIEDQFYLAYDEEFVLLHLAGVEAEGLVEPAPQEFKEAGFDGYLLAPKLALSPNGKYLAISSENWLSVQRTSDGTTLFWANPCGRNDSCRNRGLSITDEGLVLIEVDNNFQIWSVDR